MQNVNEISAVVGDKTAENGITLNATVFEAEWRDKNSLQSFKNI